MNAAPAASSRTRTRTRRAPRLLASTAGGVVLASFAFALPLSPAAADTAPPGTPSPTPSTPTTPPAPPLPTPTPTTPPPVTTPPLAKLPAKPVTRPAESQLSRVGGFAFTVFKRMTFTQYEKVSLPVTVPTFGLFRTDCSGFTNYLLQRVSPTAYRSLVRVGRAPRPISATYAYVMPKAPAGWAKVARVSGLRNGDIIAWPQPRGKSAGHVMVVADRATKTGPRTWLVPIMDSTTQSHGRFDSRATDSRALRNSSGRVGGVGTGYLLLVTNAAGAPIYYGWNPQRAERVRPSVIALGRPVA